jgi:hypothetical protein
MLLMNPRQVRFGATRWNDVRAVAIDRTPARELVEFGDHGPHAVFADVPEQRVDIRVIQDLSGADESVDAPLPGEQAELSLHIAPTGASAARKRVSAQAVILRVTHEVSLKRGAVRTVDLVAISDDGDDDPVTIVSDPDGQS